MSTTVAAGGHEQYALRPARCAHRDRLIGVCECGSRTKPGREPYVLAMLQVHRELVTSCA